MNTNIRFIEANGRKYRVFLAERIVDVKVEASPRMHCQYWRALSRRSPMSRVVLSLLDATR